MALCFNEFAGKFQNPVPDTGDGPCQPRIIKPAARYFYNTVKRVHDDFLQPATALSPSIAWHYPVPARVPQ